VWSRPAFGVSWISEQRRGHTNFLRNRLVFDRIEIADASDVFIFLVESVQVLKAGIDVIG
jgi:hypothetical protein